jgi:hypothetical protein
MTRIVLTTVPDRLDLSHGHEFRSGPWRSNVIVSRPLGRPALRRVDDYGHKGSFRLSDADEGSFELRRYICSRSESRGNLPSSDRLVGDIFVYTKSGKFKYNYVSLSVAENDPLRLDNFTIKFTATGKEAVG